MRLEAFHSHFFINPQFRTGRLQVPKTARAMAKELVRGIDSAELKTKKSLFDQLKKINEGVDSLNKRINKIPEYKLDSLRNKSIINYRDKLIRLTDSSDKLILSKRNSVFQETGISNTAPEVAQISSVREPRAGSRGFEVSVKAIARNQISGFDPVKHLSGLHEKESGFKLRADHKSFDIKVDQNGLSAPKTNEAVLKELSNKVNDLKLGITAEIEKNKDGASLKLSADRTGTKYSFQISEETGIIKNSVEIRKAEDAVYSINDGELSKEYRSDSNQVDLPYYGVKGKFLNIGTTKIGFDSVDKAKVSEAIEKMVRDYNELSEIQKEQRQDKQILFDYKAIERKKDLLYKIGLDYNKDENKFFIDKRRQQLALDHHYDDLKKIIGGPGGLAFQIKEFVHNSFGKSRNTDEMNQLNNAFDMRSAHNKGVNNSWSNNQPVLFRKNLYGFDRTMFLPFGHGFIQ